MKLGIASDHQGYPRKEQIKVYLKKLGYEIIDYGTNNEESVDYPDYAFKIGKAINEKEIEKGILFCGTGIGMSIAANKVKNIRCAKVDNKEEAHYARIDNDANVIALNSSLSLFKTKKIINTYLTSNEKVEERHLRRIEKINNYHD